MKEIPFFFPNGICDLFGVLHEPATGERDTGFVFCYPFAEEKLWVHRVFVNFARILGERGHAVLRFDYMGHGDSGGEFAEATVESRLRDIACAVEALKEKAPAVKRVGLLGLRFGAMLAAVAAERDATLSHLILWEPVIKGSAYMKEMLRINLATQMAVFKEIRQTREELVGMLDRGRTVNIDGYEIGGEFYRETSGIDLLSGDNGFAGKVLIVEVRPREGENSKQMTALKESYGSAELALAVEQPFWKEIRSYYPKADDLSRMTLAWLEG
jgi:exosortase A-associated hydrolase 2